MKTETGSVNIVNMHPKCAFSELKYQEIPESESWGVPLLKKLLGLRSSDLTLPDNFFTSDELEDLIRFTATS